MISVPGYARGKDVGVGRKTSRAKTEMAKAAVAAELQSYKLREVGRYADAQVAAKEAFRLRSRLAGIHLRADPTFRIVLTELARSAKEGSRGRRHIHAALDGRLGRLVLDAIEVAIETGGPISLILANQLHEKDDVELARWILPFLPERTVSLREVALVVTTQVLKGLGRSDTRASDLTASVLLNDL